MIFQRLNADNGAAAGRTHRVLQRAGVLAGSKQHFRRTGHGHGGVFHCLGSGKAAGHRAVGQRFHKHVHKGRAAAGQGACRVDQPFFQRVQQAAEAHIFPPVVQRFILHKRVAAVRNDPFADGRGSVGHDADDGQLRPGELLQFRNFHARRHGNEQRFALPQNLLQQRKHLLHHMGLHCDKNPVAPGGDGFRVRIDDAQFLRERLRLAGTVGHHDLLRGSAQGFGNGAAHVAAADKSVLHVFPPQRICPFPWMMYL